MDGQNKSYSSVTVELLLLEVDGVLTDGRAWLDSTGVLRRRFSVRDSIALRALRREGVRVVAITKSESPDIDQHLAFVGIDECIQGCTDKAAAVQALLLKFGLAPSQVASVIKSDEDAWMATELGCVIAVQSAGELAKRVAMTVTVCEGGDGAVREACNTIRSSRMSVDFKNVGQAKAAAGQ